MLTARSPKQSAQKHTSATVALAGAAKRSRSAQVFEEDNASSSSSSRQASSPSTSVLSDAMNKSAKRARHSSPQSDQQAELPTASAAEELLSSGSPSPEQPDVCQCEAELPLQPDIEQEITSSGDTESGRLAAVKEEECEVDVPGGEQGSLVDANEEENSSSDEESAGQEPAGVNTIAEEVHTSEEDSSEEEEEDDEAAQQPEHDERSAASASSREVPASHDSAAASMQSGGESNDDQQEVPADGTKETPGSDNRLQLQPVLTGKVSKLHWSVLLADATGSSPWAAWYNTWLLMKLTLTAVVFSCLFYLRLCFCGDPQCQIFTATSFLGGTSSAE